MQGFLVAGESNRDAARHCRAWQGWAGRCNALQGKVFLIDNYDPHGVYKMRCRACHHRWVAVAPIGVDDENLECPNCGHLTGEAYLPGERNIDDRKPFC
jgi:hypothetical protein